MNKSIYVAPEFAITLFEADNVILASNLQYTTEEEKDIELPFVPIKPKYY